MQIYESSGISLSDRDFSRVFIFKEADRKKIGDMVGFPLEDDGRVIVQLGIAIVFAREETKDILPSIVHHELEHMLGRFYDVKTSKGFFPELSVI